VYHLQSFVSDMKNRNLIVNELNITYVQLFAHNFVDF
jgi:small-conductance mechanosensitive channel